MVSLGLFHAVQLASSDAGTPSLAIHVTARVVWVTVERNVAVIQLLGQGRKSAATQLYVGHDTVAAQTLVATGFVSAQLSAGAITPSLPMHDTARVCVDSPKPQSVGQAANSSTIHSYVMQAAVAAQSWSTNGFA
jgi:hypothetical protein